VSATGDKLKRVRTTHLARKKAAGEKIPVLTAYDATMARLLEMAGVEVILVGDSLGMILLGHETTVPVTMADMLHHTKAVTRVVERALVIADMPFLSFNLGTETTLRHAGQLLAEAGAAAVKMEGAHIAAVRALVDAGIPVMGHLGLLPQHVHQLGGYPRVNPAAATQLISDALAVEAAGAFSIVLECVPTELAREVSQALKVPTIGIGSGPDCDGQVLVSHDLLGLTTGPVPSFVKPYAALGETLVTAVRSFCSDVRTGAAR
jgi:3-methyl-2-oxobutanoate hydroxymethyltransferase